MSENLTPEEYEAAMSFPYTKEDMEADGAAPSLVVPKSCSKLVGDALPSEAGSHRLNVDLKLSAHKLASNLFGILASPTHTAVLQRAPPIVGRLAH